jgi:hypothetical protein
MALLSRRRALTLLWLSLLVALAACAQSPEEPLPTLAPVADPVQATPIPPRPTLPPPPIITVPSGAAGSTAIALPAGNTSSQVVVQMSATGTALPDEIQQLLDDLASGALLLNSSPAGQGGEPVNYAYRDLNGDGNRDLVVIVVAEPMDQSGPAAAPADEPVQAIGINLDELVASISANPEAPLIRSAFVYTLSQEELEQLDTQ